MTPLAALRDVALALPGVVETTHFRLPSFTVAGKGFVTVEQGEHSAILAADAAAAEELAAAEPNLFEVVRRSEKVVVGIRVDLAAVAPERLAALVEAAWRTKAPKSLQASYTG
jgi:hypothetical protein